MIQIRRGVFETNSSSTHSITLCSEENYNKWKNGEVLKADDYFITREKAIEEVKQDEWFNKDHPNFDYSDIDTVNEVLDDYEYCTYKQYFKDDYLESFKETFTTPGGETVVAFGKYGYNG